MGEEMKDEGLDPTANVRILPSGHSKGFVIDSATVVVAAKTLRRRAFPRMAVPGAAKMTNQ